MDGESRGKKQYGLQLQIKAPPKKPARPAVSAFRFDDGNDANTVEDDIARQATKKQTIRDVEQQHKKALEEDPLAFDYDGVYDEMKGNQARPIQEDRAKREPKYIGKLLEKAKERAREHDIVYERQLAKEREKEDHLYGDKEKFVTGAYKKKLMEQAKWAEEERLRELREQKHEVTNKNDMSDFYRNLLKNNVAFGGRNLPKPSESTIVAVEKEAELPERPSSLPEEVLKPSTRTSQAVELDDSLESSGQSPRGSREEGVSESRQRGHRSKQRQDRSNSPVKRIQSKGRADDAGVGRRSKSTDGSEDDRMGEARTEETVSVKATNSNKPEAVDVPTVDPVAAAKERYLNRKRQRGL